MKIKDIPVGTLSDITTGEMRCTECGNLTTDVSYIAIASNQYLNINGVQRRKFVYPYDRRPEGACGCSDGIWLPCDEEVNQ
jgi:hypothetical protein